MRVLLRGEAKGKTCSSVQRTEEENEIGWKAPKGIGKFHAPEVQVHFSSTHANSTFFFYVLLFAFLLLFFFFFPLLSSLPQYTLQY